MAVFQLGSLVSRISGSIGGTTFRRVGSQNVVSNKSSGGTRSNLLKNKALIDLSQIFKSWKTLTSEKRAGWNSTALLYPVIDKFGNSKFLTGRQFFIKYNSQLSVVGVKIVNDSDFNTIVDEVTLKAFVIDVSAQSAVVNFSCDNGPVFVLLQFDRLNLPDNLTKINRRKFLNFTTISADGNINVWNDLIAKYGQINSTDNFRVMLTAMNSSGVRLPVQLENALLV